MSRKDRLLKNLGGAFAAKDTRRTGDYYEGAPTLAQHRTSIVLSERVIKSLLQEEVERLTDDPELLREFFMLFFDPAAADGEVDTYVANFLKQPPKVVLGYPRDLAQVPLFSIILTSDDESTEGQSIGRYVGRSLDDENVSETLDYEGGYFDQVNSVYIYAQHPDVCLYMYHFAKLTLYGARDRLVEAGIIEPTYSGGEVSPDEMPYLPENIFTRQLSVSYKTMVTVPKRLPYRRADRLSVTGLFREDTVVNGRRGSVKTYTESNDGE